MRAISSMATRLVLHDLARAAEQSGLAPMSVESVGGVDAAARVASGEAFDLVFLADDALRKLAASGHVDPSTLTAFALSQVAVGVPSHDDAPATPAGERAFPDAAGMRAALRSATRIGYSTGPSGTAFVLMIGDWAMTAEVGAKLVQAPPGVPVAQLLADGAVDLGLQQLSELVGRPGVRILGVLPPDCAIDTAFSGAVAATSERPDAASALLAFLDSEQARHIIGAHHFGLPPA